MVIIKLGRDPALSPNPSAGDSLYVLLNPAAGGGRAGRLWPGLEQRLTQVLGKFRLLRSNGPGDIETLAEQAVRGGCHRLIVCGGDGTLHEAVNGLYRCGAAPKPVLGIIPLGRGSDFAKTLSLPKAIERQIEVIRAGMQREIDLGLATFQKNGSTKTRVFLNMADIGFGADVLKDAASLPKFYGRWAYPISVLRCYRTWKERKVCFSLKTPEGNTESWSMNLLCAVAANGRFFGGGMPIAPRALPNDGLLEVVALPKLPLFCLPLALPFFYGGGIHWLPNVKRVRAVSLTVTSEKPESVAFEMDGEPGGSLPVTVTILPRSLSVTV